MNGRTDILFVVEGERLEPKVVGRMAEAYGFRCDVASVCTNIHVLYQTLKRDEGYTDAIPVLKEILGARLSSLEAGAPFPRREEKIRKTRDDIETLGRRFSSIYLVFDSELHHRSLQGEHTLAAVGRNAAELKEMLEFFNNETEQGKLYVNYPMMDSFRDCDDFFDKGYRDRLVSLDVLFGKNGYKRSIASRRLAGVHVGGLTREQLDRLVCMNVFKLNWMKNSVWGMPSYKEYAIASEQEGILGLELDMCRRLGSVAVLNTLLFFVLDYRGRDFYEGLVLPLRVEKLNALLHD